MNPQLVVSYDFGKHNSDLKKSAARIIEDGSWKKQRIITIIPAGAQIPTKVYLNHLGIIYPPNQAVHRMAAIGMEVGKAFSNAIEQIIAHPDLSQWEYILTIEHDNMPPADGVLKLIKRMEAHPEFACISGIYWTKGEGGVPQIWGDPKDPVLNFRPQPPVPGQLVECCGTGMGFALWRISMFKDPKLRKPWFETQAGLNGVGTQDLYAWSDFRKHGYRCAVDCDVLVGHYDLAGDQVW